MTVSSTDTENYRISEIVREKKYVLQFSYKLCSILDLTTLQIPVPGVPNLAHDV